MFHLIVHNRKQRLVALSLAGLAAVMVFTATIAAAAETTSSGGAASPSVGATSAGMARDLDTQNAAISFLESGQLSDTEREDLLYMREEEKLARDLYAAFYDQWGLRIFQNIAASEQRHMDAIKTLLDRYVLEDPVGSNDPGLFSDPALQALYDQLYSQGSHSVVAALQVGAEVEEVDILDLVEALAHTEEADISTVYGNLLRGSENHLRAFSTLIERLTQESYQPLHLDQEAYDAIISDREVGGGQGGWQGQRRGNGHGGRR